MDKEVNDAYVAMTLKNIYEKTNDEITLDAMANRALAEKITSEIINQKVNSQMSAISVGIRNINPRYTEKSKNYDITKSAILNSLTNYEAALVELSEFYDKKIEQLILRKVELEASLLGSIIRDEYLYKKENKKLDQKENDKVKKKISTAFKGMIEKLTVKKQDKVTDINLIHDAMDIVDIKTEILEKTGAINYIEHLIRTVENTNVSFLGENSIFTLENRAKKIIDWLFRENLI